MEFEDITGKVIGCAYKVYNTMGFGFLESVYEKCMCIELRKSGLTVESQKPIPVTYEGHSVGDFIADLVVEGQIIVELKSVHHLINIHEIQLVNYLVATGIQVGLLINFGDVKVEIKRKLRSLPVQSAHAINPVLSCNPVQIKPK